MFDFLNPNRRKSNVTTPSPSTGEGQGSGSPLFVNLPIPRSYNDCTTEQLEGISRIFIAHAKAYTETGRYSEISLLTECFFLLSGLEVINRIDYEDGDTDTDGNTPYRHDDDEYDTADHGDVSSLFSSMPGDSDLLPSGRMGEGQWVVQFRDEQLRSDLQTYDGEIRPIHITTAEIYALAIGTIDPKDLDRYLKAASDYEIAKEQGTLGPGPDGKPMKPPTPPAPRGPLSWLLDRSTLTRFPYPEWTPSQPPQGEDHKAAVEGGSASVMTLHGPDPLMSNFTWRQYRTASDYMQAITRYENSLIQMRKRPDHYTPARIQRVSDTLDRLRREWLATLFTASIPHLDPETGQTVTSHFFVSSQSQELATLFADFGEERLQCVLLWWQGMMAKLAKDYPKVFRSGKPGSKTNDDDPLKLYSRSTATMIKYSGTTEEETNRRTYTVVLQMINDMADENDAVKEMRSKHHKK